MPEKYNPEMPLPDKERWLALLQPMGAVYLSGKDAGQIGDWIRSLVAVEVSARAFMDNDKTQALTGSKQLKDALERVLGRRTHE